MKKEQLDFIMKSTEMVLGDVGKLNEDNFPNVISENRKWIHKKVMEYFNDFITKEDKDDHESSDMIALLSVLLGLHLAILEDSHETSTGAIGDVIRAILHVKDYYQAARKAKPIMDQLVDQNELNRLRRYLSSWKGEEGND